MASEYLRRENIARLRRCAALFIAATEQFKAATEEAEMLGVFQPPENGGLTQDDFVGPDAGLSAADLLAFVNVLTTLLTPMTTEQRQAVYKVKATSQIGMPLSYPL